MSGDIGVPDSQNDVLTTATHFLEEFENCIRIEMPKTAVLFDDQLSYETAVKLLRNRDDFQDQETDNLPLFAYKRSVMKEVPDKGLSLRAKGKKGCITLSDGTIAQYNMTYGEFDIFFAYFTKDIELLEKFEVAYNGEVGVSEIKEVTVSMGELGEFKYFVEWNELDDYTVEEDENNYFKSVIGSAKARGFFFTFSGESNIIKEINAQFIAGTPLPDPTEEEILGQCDIIAE